MLRCWADSTGPRNTSTRRLWMGRPAGWMQELTGRSPMKSPGAPSHRREIEREFWKQVATGITSEAAAEAVGVSQAVGGRWFRHGGGMPPMDWRGNGPLLVVRRARRDRAAPCAGWWGEIDCSPARPAPVDGVSRATTQRCDSWRQARVSGVGRPVEGGPGRAAAQDVETRRKSSAVRLRRGPPVGCRPRLRRRDHRASRTSVDRPEQASST